MRNGRTSLGVMGFALWLAACGTGGHAREVGAGGAVPAGGASGQAGGAGGANGASPAGGSGSGGVSGGGALGTGGDTSTTGGALTTGGRQAGGATDAGGASRGGAGTGGLGWGAASGTGGSGTGGVAQPTEVLVTSSVGAYWQIGTYSEDTDGAVNVTVLDGTTAQAWDGMGGAFNEIGWSVLTTQEMKDQAVRWLFDANDGANLAWGLIPVGATDYAIDRYTLDDTGDDVIPNADESNRPTSDDTLAKFSLDRDGKLLIPYVKAAQRVKPDLRFWAAPWTPPVWMKTGYKKNSSNGNGNTPAPRPSYYDGGTVRSDALTLNEYAQYFVKFVQGYAAQGIAIAVVAPQNEPTFDQNSPSCLWDKATMTSFIAKSLGPAMRELNVRVMLGDLANAGSAMDDINLATTVLADPGAASFVDLVGVEWGALDKLNSGTKLGTIPVWVTTHKFGNYPFCSSANPPTCPAPYNSSAAPNDHAYGVESWGYLRDAITKARVSVYNAWNMVLDKSGLGIDTGRDWKQDALLVADGGKVTPTPAYYVFRHVSQYVVPGAVVVGTSGGDAVAFKNPDGSLVAVIYNSGAAVADFAVAMGGKKLRFAMPANGWATLKR
jgi:glucosylceramidase